MKGWILSWRDSLRKEIFRRELKGIVVVVDSRLEPTEMDISLIDFLNVHQIPTIIGVTKADKLSRNKMIQRKRHIEKSLGENTPVILYSSFNGLGKKELWKNIKNLIE